VTRAIPPLGYRTQSEDTPYELEVRLVERWAAMEPAEKLDQAAASFRALRALSIEGQRRRHPEASEDELRLRAAAASIGRELLQRHFDWDPEERGW
jgi:hypothetical protein